MTTSGGHDRVGPAITITKMDAARRQLATAIELWFEDSDPVSIHTLAFAAHEIIYRRFEKLGHKGMVFDAPFIDGALSKLFRQKFAENANFFKHHNRAEETVDFNPELNEVIFMTSIMGLITMSEALTLQEDAFHKWTLFSRPELFPEDSRPKQIPVELLRDWNKKQFFKALRPDIRRYADAAKSRHT
jgi:hypothetical protein